MYVLLIRKKPFNETFYITTFLASIIFVSGFGDSVDKLLTTSVVSKIVDETLGSKG